MKVRFHHHYKKHPFLARLYVGTIWSLVGAATTRFSSLITSILVARIIGVESFGSFVVLQSTIALFGVFSGLGIGVVATKFSAELIRKDPNKLGKLLTFLNRVAIAGGLVTSIGVASFSSGIANHAMHQAIFTGLIELASISIFLQTIDGYNNASLIGLEEVKKSTIGSILSSIAGIPIALFLTWEYGLLGATIGMVFLNAIQVLTSTLILKRSLKSHKINTGSVDIKDFKVIRDYALPALLGSVIVSPSQWVAQILLLNGLGGAVQVAILGVGLQWYQVVFFFPVAFGKIVQPILTDALNNGKKIDVKIVLKISVILNGLISIFIAIILILLSKIILNSYGIDIEDASKIFSLLIIAAVISVICAPVGQILVANGKNWYGFYMNLFWTLVFIVLAYLFKSNGALGIAYAYLGSYVIHTIWTFSYAYIYMKD